jgi:hypothetical protein
MKRNYTDGIKEEVSFFTGVEIEKTPAFGMQTLFVAGVQSVPSILEMAGEHYCKHIYFGANQSFPKIDTDDARVWKQWEVMIQACLDADFWCTLDLDVSCVEGLLEGTLVEHRRFIPQLSVKIPYLTLLGYNATIKIDDKDFDATNPGVWCHRLRDLTTTDSFTDWDQYGKDEIIK